MMTMLKVTLMLLADHSEGDDDDDDDDEDDDAAAAADDEDADLMPYAHRDDYDHGDDESDLDDDGISVTIIILQIMVEMTDGCQCQMPGRNLERFEAVRRAAVTIIAMMRVISMMMGSAS